MSPKVLPPSVLALLLAACVSTSTATPGTSGPPATTLSGYLAAGDLDGAAIVGPPPTPQSARGRSDQAIYDETRALAGTPRWDLAIQDNDIWRGGALKRYACAAGRDIGEATTPVTLRMLHRIELDARTVGTPPKDHYARRRPALGNDKPVCVPREPWMETNASYPSGHSMNGWAWALVLAEALPQRASALLTLGRESGESRMICGVHYESDVEAGRTLGAGMVARLHAEPAFLADLAAAKRELAAAPAATGCGG